MCFFLALNKYACCYVSWLVVHLFSTEQSLQNTHTPIGWGSWLYVLPDEIVHKHNQFGNILCMTSMEKCQLEVMRKPLSLCYCCCCWCFFSAAAASSEEAFIIHEPTSQSANKHLIPRAILTLDCRFLFTLNMCFFPLHHFHSHFLSHLVFVCVASYSGVCMPLGVAFSV